MARKLYVYDDEARRRLGNRNFLKEFQGRRDDYVALGRQFYKMLARTPSRLPLKADVQAILTEYLYSDAEFSALILQKVGSLETRHNLWCGWFAAMVLDEAWSDIIR